MNRLYKMSLPNLFILLSLFSTLLFISVGLLFGNTALNLSSSSMRQAMSQLSQNTFIKVLEMEMPYLNSKSEASIAQPKPISLFLFETITNLRPTDLRSLLGRELPGLSTFNSEALKIGSNVQLEHYVIESAPPIDVLHPSSAETNENKSLEEADKAKEEKKSPPVTVEKRTVLIYNTHNTESWTHVVNNPDPVDDETNITLVSKRLAEDLQRKGIRTIFDNTNHQKKLKEKGLSYAFSYAESLKTVKAAMQQHQDIGFIFDIHRDSPRKEATTVKINGKSYARPFFVIGKRNPHWERNSQLAEKMHDLLEEKYPGLSIGVFAKGEGNGEYNQSVSPNSILIEIGGIDNTLEECYNTTAALADIFADIYFEKEKKVNAPASSNDKSM